MVWVGSLLIAGCGDESTLPVEPPALTLDAELREGLQRWGIVPIGPMPAQNPAQVELGRALFFDPILSGNKDISCATCHHPTTSLGDGRALPVGTGGAGIGPSRTRPSARELVPRSSPSLLNSGLGMSYILWDGRLSKNWSGALELAEGGVVFPGPVTTVLTAQALLPLLDRREMRGEPGDLDALGEPNELAELADNQHAEIWAAVMRRLVAIPEYVDLFRAAYPNTPSQWLRIADAAQAVAAFEMEAFTRTNSPFDRYLNRDDLALTLEQKRGALIFVDRGLCASCHGGPFLGGERFSNAGVPQFGPGVGDEAPLDLGRGGLPGNAHSRFAFRAAPLRNVELTAPYMHNGAFPTLDAVVRHYDDVGTTLRTYDPSHLDPDLRASYQGDSTTIADVLSTLDWSLRTPLHLTDAEIRDLVTFLESLTDPSARDLADIAPASVPSGLPVE